MALPVIATGNEVSGFTAPDGAGHPAAVLKILPLWMAQNYSGTDFVASGGSVTVTSSTVLVDTTLDTPPLLAGATYILQGYLNFTSGAAGGLALSPTAAGTGVATATLFTLDVLAYTASALSAHNTISALSSNLFSAAAAITLVQFEGLLTVNAAGTFGLSFAQNTSNATATVLNAGSWLRLSRIA